MVKFAQQACLQSINRDGGFVSGYLESLFDFLCASHKELWDFCNTAETCGFGLASKIICCTGWAHKNSNLSTILCSLWSKALTLEV